jgi:glycosyl transferase family 25
MKLVVISLERALDRRARMREQLDALGLEFEFFDAIDASKGQLVGVSRYNEACALRMLGHALLPAEVGCFASHYLLWKHCAESGEPIIVMEDDLELGPLFAKLPILLKAPLQRYGFIRLAGLVPRSSQNIERLPDGFRVVRYFKGPRGTQCYALDPKAARALLKKAEMWIDAVDLYVDAFWIHGVSSYAVLPSQVGHLKAAVAASSIGDVRWERRRSGFERLRRGLTRMVWSWRRQWFNLRCSLRSRRRLWLLIGGLVAAEQVAPAAAIEVESLLSLPVLFERTVQALQVGTQLDGIGAEPGLVEVDQEQPAIAVYQDI